MKLRLLKGLKKSDEDEFKAQFIQAQRFRKRMREVIDEELASLHKSMENEAHWDSVNWAFIQADRVAQAKALRRMKGWIEDESKEN